LPIGKSEKEFHMLSLHHLSYYHPNKERLFEDISLHIEKDQKLALIGNNGSGKSTLLKIMAGELLPSSGEVVTSSKAFYMPQQLHEYDQLTVQEVLGVDKKLKALRAILSGDTTVENFSLLQDDWMIEERTGEALRYWGVDTVETDREVSSLSGGQKTKLFLAAITIQEPFIILMDEPSNHLDRTGRDLLYNFIQQLKATLVVVSHDRQLLGLLNSVCELSQSGLQLYGGNYDFYFSQKELERGALAMDIEEKEKSIRKAKEKMREVSERQQRLNSRGKAKQEKAGVAKIMMNTLRNKAENSSAKLKSVHGEKIGELQQDLKNLREELPDPEGMKLNLDNSKLHRGKQLVEGVGINFNYGDTALWDGDLSFEIRSGERIALKGVNGSGKTTLIKTIMGALEPARGSMKRAIDSVIYLDQDYSLIQPALTVYEQAQRFNTTALQEHEIKIRLNRFLFGKEDWDKRCAVLSGGERMRLSLCCLTVCGYAPELIILDEPTNNLDLQNITILTNAISSYKGTLLVVSHDETFLHEVQADQVIELKTRQDAGERIG